MQSERVSSMRVLFDNGQNVALSLRQAHGMVGGGFAGFALSLVGGRVGGGLLGDDCWCRLAVGGGGHGSGGLLGCLLRRASVVGVDGSSGWEDALSCQARGAGWLLAGEEASKQAAEAAAAAESQRQRARRCCCKAASQSIKSAAMK